MRFNDYHKQIVAALKLTPEQGRDLRTFMLRCFTGKVSPNACVALVKIELAKKADARSSTAA